MIQEIVDLRYFKIKTRQKVKDFYYKFLNPCIHCDTKQWCGRTQNPYNIWNLYLNLCNFKITGTIAKIRIPNIKSVAILK